MKLNFFEIFKVILILFFSFFIVFLQIYYFSLLSHPYNLINISLPALIFIFLISKTYLVWFLAFFIAYFLDLLSFHFFSLNIIIYISVVFLMTLWLRNWFTNHSLYSFFTLTGLILVLKNLVYFIFIDYNYLLKYEFYIDLIWQIIFTNILVVIVYYLSLTLNKKLKPYILGKSPLS